ncbi:MAG: FKBP-type peptidyl-prolyl cis-trans isomerase [Nanoarchaeota archaeon]
MIKKNDFVEIEYTGKTSDEGIVFDTTNNETAKENGLNQQNTKFGPKIVCVGESQVIPGLDKDLEGKEPGKEYSVQITPEEGFGKKSAKNIQLVPTKQFHKQNINPMPGLQVNIDNQMGIVKTVTGGRTMVDFNHPLASKELVYEYKINKVINDTKQKVDSYLQNSIGLPAETNFSEGKLNIEIKFELPEEAQKKIEEKLKEVIQEIKEIEFSTGKNMPEKKIQPKGNETQD